MKRWVFMLIAGVMALPSPGVALGQSDYTRPTVLTLHPAGEPSPALNYTLLPKRRDLVPGNAAVFYHRALLMLQERRNAERGEARRMGKDQSEIPEIGMSDWINGPIDAIPREEARALLDRYESILREVELGVLRRDCDWGFDNRPETIELLLPEIQESRSLARLISLRVRMAVLDGDTEGAVHWLQTGYAMARHVGRGPTLIQWLVGVAITGVMNEALIELIQAEGTPSLYWALTNLPRPMIDLDEAIEGERSLVERMFPELLELDGPAWSAERGRIFLDRLADQLQGLTGSTSSDQSSMTLLLTSLITRNYPEAKRELIASGRDEVEVEAMPAIQVVGILAWRDYVALSDDVYKWVSLPSWDATLGIKTTYSYPTIEEKLSRPGLSLFLLISPALESVLMAQTRTDRQLAALRCVEAIRLYADAHDGRFPPSLEAIEEAPAPLDPATGAPFGYEVEGEEAALTAPPIPGGPDIPAYRINYRLRMAD
ncbi:hypothetical protein [Tautonia rosea]|uniref:hypothetical protein n=1 Tax=Tautonia rosea TaxID=2728037 RepID=UPI0014743CE9|nr:hypothetical protein [Tautonia rosea]